MSLRPAPIAARTARSRAEALRRDLLDSVVVPEDHATIQVRAGQWSEALGPRDPFQAWLVDQIAVITLRVERCQRSERRLRDRASLRAEVCWEDDRRLEAEAIGSTLSSRPSEVVERLRKTAAGCDWLIRRWALLAHAADHRAGGEWTADQARLAFDLLATPAEFRDGRPGVRLDDDGREIDPGTEPADMARGQLAGLRDRRDRLAEVEEVDRALVVADLFDEPSAEIRRLRRHEATLQARLRWSLAQLRTASVPAPVRVAEVPPAVEPAPPARSRQAQPPRPVVPPFDLDYEECLRSGDELLARMEARMDEQDRLHPPHRN